MEKSALRYAPRYWNKKAQGTAVRKEFLVERRSTEFLQIIEELREAVLSKKSCKSIVRNQNAHDYSQLLLKEQLLCVSHKDKTFYRVRRYAVVSKDYLDYALNYNFDYRRCGFPRLQMSKYVTDVLRNEVLLIFQVVTCDIESVYIRPDNSSEFMIDYIVEFN